MLKRDVVQPNEQAPDTSGSGTVLNRLRKAAPEIAPAASVLFALSLPASTATLAGSTAAALLNSGCSHEQQSEKVDINRRSLEAASLLFEGLSHKINFETVYNGLPKNVEDAINHLNAYGRAATRSINFPGGNPFNGEKWELDLRRSIWKQLKADLPEWVSGDYAPGKLQEFLSLKLPDLLSQYGVVALLNSHEATENGKDYHYCIIPRFFQIASIDTVEITPQKYAVQLTLGPEFTLTGLDKQPETAPAMGIYGVIIRNPNIDINDDVSPSEARAMVNQNTFIFNEALTYSDVAAKKPYELMSDRALLTYYKHLPENGELEQNLYSHEYGHIEESGKQTPEVSALQEYTRQYNFPEAMVAIRAQQELKGLLTELMYSRNKAVAWYRVVASISDTERLDYNLAGRWIVQQFTKHVLEDPAAYGMTIRQNSSADPVSQVMAWLGMVADKPEVLERLARATLLDYQKERGTLEMAHNLLDVLGRSGN
ncbi:MAG: hypothetical protein D6719_09135 [Candidatus Dadabacteria bacterium]|nr:MAG: hypothetical protein D6719_09135 [Candidatus Dadabacteria bacterium]